jgi:histone-lysine N-methyltransferase SETMAR
VQLKDILKEKRRGKFTKNILFLKDNAPAHRALATWKKLAYLGFQCLDHPPYSPDLAPSDYHLFPGLKKQLKGLHSSSLLPRRPGCTDILIFFLSGLRKLEQRGKKCIELRGECVE